MMIPSAYVSFGPPAGPGLCEIYSGPSFLLSFACNVAICFAVSSEISMKDASWVMTDGGLNVPCICGAKDIGPCTDISGELQNGWPNGPFANCCADRNELKRCPLNEPAIEDALVVNTLGKVTSSAKPRCFKPSKSQQVNAPHRGHVIPESAEIIVDH